MTKRVYEKNLISVLTLTHNSARYVTEALDSLIMQTYTNWESLVIDDASTDDSIEAIMSYVRCDSRVRFLGTAPTRRGQDGIAPLRNECLRSARGEFVAVLDADDLRYPGSFEVSLSAFTMGGEFGVVSTQYDEIDESGQLRGGSTCLHGRRAITAGIQAECVDITAHVYSSGGGSACPIAPCATVLRRHLLDCVGGYNDAWRYHTDSNLYRRLARDADARFCILPDVLSAYRMHGEQRSAVKRLEGWVEPERL